MLNTVFAAIKADKHRQSHLRCRHGSHCWPRTKGHRLWPLNAPRRNFSLRTIASAACRRPPLSGPTQNGKKKLNGKLKANKNKRQRARSALWQ